MTSRLTLAFVICSYLATSAAAQVVRFETTVGNFEMVLNPTNDPRLQGNVDNLLQYVEDNRYSSSWINRAPEGFVLQMGGFFSHTKRVPITIASTRPVFTFDPVRGVPASSVGLSNTVGTVAFALPSDINQNPLRDAGTSSFFINLASNTFLDPNFTVFAAIPDMTVVNQIMSLMQVDLTANPLFGAGSGNAGFEDVPLSVDGKQVFITRAFVVIDSLSVARARAGVQSTMAMAAATFNGEDVTSEAPISAAAHASIAVPEPASAAMLLLGLFCLMGRRGGRSK